jgi:ABC-type branched-subunit amino acid transport system ATPase component
VSRRNTYLERLVRAAHDVAVHDGDIRVLLGEVDWGRCEALEDTGFETLSCLRQKTSGAIEDLDKDVKICQPCQVNRNKLAIVRVSRRKRYLAMLRVSRLSKYVSYP